MRDVDLFFLFCFIFGGFVCLFREISLYFTLVTLKKSVILRKSYVSESLSVSPGLEVI